MRRRSLVFVRRSQLRAALDATHVQAVDTTGGCSPQPNYHILVVSEKFAGKRMLQQHQLVYAALGEAVSGMHAATIVTRTPEQYDADKDNL